MIRYPKFDISLVSIVEYINMCKGWVYWAGREGWVFESLRNKFQFLKYFHMYIVYNRLNSGLSIFGIGRSRYSNIRYRSVSLLNFFLQFGIGRSRDSTIRDRSGLENFGSYQIIVPDQKMTLTFKSTLIYSVTAQ